MFPTCNLDVPILSCRSLQLQYIAKKILIRKNFTDEIFILSIYFSIHFRLVILGRFLTLL
uniref:Uncharacterized protein n=1 Tax=Rhizophora mucronata TaxID=61149 RepID=A0A2P2QBL5_RHIMU